MLKQTFLLTIFFFVISCQVKKGGVEGGGVITGPVTNYTTTISGTTNKIADNVDSSTITITILDSGSPVVGVVPTYSVSGSNNFITPCTASDVTGISTCTLKSTKAEVKNIAVTTPNASTSSSVTFLPGTASATTSTIFSGGPTVADGVASMVINVTLKDAFGNFISGVVPTFSATNTGTTNVYGACSATNSSGGSVCSLKSLRSEIKTLKITSPVTMNGGPAFFLGGPAVAANSNITGTTPHNANGTDPSTVTITLKDVNMNPTMGVVPTFSATGAGNVYSGCSTTDITGSSTCTLKSTSAGVKTLSILTPVAKSGSTVTFNAVVGTPVAANSTITGTTPVVADGVATSTITITLKDSGNLGVPGIVPTFLGTDTNATNAYGVCSATDASGVSTCTLTSTVAEIKTLMISTPVVKIGGSTTFIAGPPSSMTSGITGSSPVVADGVAASTISVTILDAFNNPIAGQTPTFSATDTGFQNIYGACSVTNAAGISTCSLKSTVAESKTLQLLTPVIATGGNVAFIAGAADAANSSISGSGPVIADGTASSTVSILLKDVNNNPVIGQTPTFGATDTGTDNVYGTCSATDSTGLSTCTLKSTTAETKTLSIATPVVKAGGTVVFNPAGANAANSSITGTGPVTADGVATSTVTITLKDAANNAVPGVVPVFSATDTGTTNTYGTCSSTNASGISTCTLAATKAELKTLSITSPITKAGGTVNFVAGVAAAAASTISGTTPVVADGTASSTVTITLLDAFNNPVAGQTPTFDATDTGSTNSYGACSVGDASGVSTCTMTSTVAEAKTLSIATPFVKAGGIVNFIAGTPVAANSTITGSTPVVADGVDSSAITIVLNDINMNPVSGITPTFGATGSSNTYGTCSVTDATGTSTCTLSSTVAESKTIGIATPLVKAGNAVVFTAAGASVANSSITGTTPVVADGTASSTVTITLKDANNNSVVGTVPTFSATDTGTTNSYSVCSATDASGISTCTLSSLKAEVKTLSLTSPITKTGGTVTFTAGSPVAANSSVTGSSPVVADGSATSTVTIVLKDVNNNAVSGQTPTFGATDTGSSNVYGACSATDATGTSTCTLSSLNAETKTLAIATPVVKAGGTVMFIAGTPVAANSTITGTSPVVADGTATSTVTITLNDINNNPVAGQLPTFSATDTGASNIYGICSFSDTSGISTCTLSSVNAETKTLSIATPVIKAGGNVVFTAASASVANSTITGTTSVVADGTATSTVTITLKDANNNPVIGTTPVFSATDTGTDNTYGTCSATDGSGISTCTLSSLTAEVKALSITSPITKIGGNVTFVAGSPVAATSTITGTSPIVADGSATSTITITLKDVNNNPVNGQTPTFDATDTGSTNVYGSCSATNASGVSTCTMTSATAEVKTLSIQTPVVKAGGFVTFTAGVPVAANSSISGTTPVVADGTATSTVTITLKDVNNNPVAGQSPTFSATDTGSSNAYGSCSVSTSFGISTCTLSSTVAETKTLSIATPVVKVGTSVVFTPGGASVANSSITGTSPVIADGTATSTVTVTLKDANNNAIVGTTPTFSATDTGSTNAYGSCSATDASGISTCTVSSLKAEVKTLSLTSPISKTGGTVTFTAGSPVAATSTITGTSPVLADGSATSTVTITLLDVNSNPVSGQTPTFTATNTGTGNAYGSCSATNATGVSTCTMTSTVAEVKTLSIATPVVKAGGTVTFTAGTAVAANSSITGTSPVTADGTATSTVTITLKDASNNPVAGQTPTFSATNTGSGNTLGSCSATDASGISTCTLASTVAETKTLSIVSPVTKTGGTVVFTAGSAVAANSSITGTSPVLADGTATSTVTITLKDASNNFVVGQTPTFGATDTGTTNTYGSCSATNASGVSTCTLKSTKAEVKTLSIATPVVKAGGTVTFTAGTPVAANSTITGTGPVAADGVASSTVTVTLLDAFSNPVSGQTPTFTATNTGTTNVYGSCSASNATGVSTCTLKSTTAETKTLSIATPVVKAGGTVVFTAGSAVAANSTITGTGPVIANGTATSTVTIVLKDASNNAVAGVTPTFSATDTGAGNTYQACSATDATGTSTCTMKSTKAEVKTLSIATPVVKAGGTVTFTAGAAVAANSTITGTSTVVADGVATSTVTITLKDANNNGVSGSTPTFSATNTGTTNVYGACSSSDATGASTCTLKSTKAQVKTLSIVTPVSKAGGTVTFIAGSASAVTTQISGTTPVSADGVSTSFISITLLDAFSNPISGVVPIFNATDTNSTNVYGACAASDTTGLSMCTLASTKAEDKTLQLTSPVAVTGSVITFSSSLPTSANSSISGTSPVAADGSTDSTITITLKDSNNNAVSGIVPDFDATDTGAGNTYDVCSMSDAGGVSTCYMQSTVAEVKALRIIAPVTKTGGNVTFTAGAVAAATSTITGTGPVVADNTATSTVTITLKDINNNPVSGQTPTFTATTGSNTYGGCSVGNASGVSTCTLKSTKAETKTLSIATPVVKAGGTVVFTAGTAVAANSTITGTGPTNPDGVSQSTITITLKDVNNNLVSGITPTFTASGTNNTYNTCSATNASGVSTCTMTSTTPETKTLSIATPVVKADGTVVFASGSPSIANSSITATGPVIANGVATSTVTITLKDNANAAVINVTPTFTSDGSNNTYNSCSVTNASGISTCTMTSTRAEAKTVSIATPIVKAGNTVTFTPGPASAATSTIGCDNTAYLADGVDECNITVSIQDAFNNGISGVTPTISVAGTSNTVSACSVTDGAGESTCTLSSTKAEGKFLSIVTPVAVSNPTEYEFNPNGINLQVPIEMVDRGLLASTTAITFTRTRTYIDPADYVGSTADYFFEISASNANTTTAYPVQLLNGAGAVITDATISVAANTTATKRLRVQFTPSAAADTYRIKLPATAATNQLKVHSARIIIEQTNAIKTKLWIPLAGGDFAGESTSDTGATLSASTTTTYAATAPYHYWFTRTDANFDAIPATAGWTLDVNLRIASSAQTCYAALFNRTTGTMIAGSEVTNTGSTTVNQKRITFNSNATNFVNGNDFEVRIKSSSTSSCGLLKAGLWVKLKYLKKADVYWRLVNRRAVNAAGVVLPDARFWYESAAWSTPTATFLAFGQTSAASGSTIQLYHTGTSDNATAGTTVTTLNPTTTLTRMSSATTLVDNNRYIINHARTSGTATIGGAFVIINTHD